MKGLQEMRHTSRAGGVTALLCKEAGRAPRSSSSETRPEGRRGLRGHLQEDGRVLLVDLDQLHVGDGVDATHGQSCHSHDHSQDHHIVAQRNNGKDQGDCQ